jgi:hypothetical protein
MKKILNIEKSTNSNKRLKSTMAFKQKIRWTIGSPAPSPNEAVRLFLTVICCPVCSMLMKKTLKFFQSQLFQKI